MPHDHRHVPPNTTLPCAVLRPSLHFQGTNHRGSMSIRAARRVSPQFLCRPTFSYTTRTSLTVMAWRAGIGARRVRTGCGLGWLGQARGVGRTSCTSSIAPGGGAGREPAAPAQRGSPWGIGKRGEMLRFVPGPSGDARRRARPKGGGDCRGGWRGGVRGRAAACAAVRGKCGLAARLGSLPLISNFLVDLQV